MTATARTIKVRVPITVEIDADAWHANYGTETVAEVREDVRRYVTDAVAQHLDSVGVSAWAVHGAA